MSTNTILQKSDNTMESPNEKIIPTDVANLAHLLIIVDKSFTSTIAEALGTNLKKDFQITLYRNTLDENTLDQNAPVAGKQNFVKEAQVYEEADKLVSFLNQEGIKRTTIFASGSSSSLAQAVALKNTTLVRRLALLNPTLRIKPSFFTRLLDKLETNLPLGLPLRPLNDNFDIRPHLHRLRMPVSILLSEKLLPQDSSISFFQLQQDAELLHHRIPNATLEHLSPCPNNDSEHHNASSQASPQTISPSLTRAIHELLQRPVKRPQKNL